MAGLPNGWLTLAELGIIQVQVDRQSMDKAKFLLETVENGVETALRRAANKTADTGKSRVARRVSEVTPLPINKVIRPRIRVGRAYFGSTTAVVFISRKPLMLVQFPYLAAPLVGVSVEIKRGKPIIFRHGFEATMKSGHTGLFERRYHSGGVPVSRLPIGQGPVSGKGARSEMVGPSIGMTFDQNGGDQVTEDLSDIFAKNLIHEAEYLLSKAG